VKPEDYYAEETVELSVNVRVRWKAAGGESSREETILRLVADANRNLLSVSAAGPHGAYGYESIGGASVRPLAAPESGTKEESRER